MKYRACNDLGLRFETDGHTKARYNTGPWVTLPASPRSPDMFGDLVIFASGEDDGSAFGTWSIRPGEQAKKIITWRSWYPGRFAPDGTYFLSGKKGDSTKFPDSGRGAYWTWKNGVLSGPFESGTTAIEGIAAFTLTPDGSYAPVWQNRGKPRTFPGNRTLSIYTLEGNWVLGYEKGTDRTIAGGPDGQWFLVAEFQGPGGLMPCVKQQTDGSLLVAWNSGDNKPTFTRSKDFTPLPPATPPPSPPPDDDDPDPDPEDEMSQTLLLDLKKRLIRMEDKIDRLLETPAPAPPPTPDPEPPDVEPGEPPSSERPPFNLNDVVWHHHDVRDWPETSHIENVTIEKRPDDSKSVYPGDNFKVRFPHTKLHDWPIYTNSGGKRYYGNVWVIGFIDGRPHAGPAEWLEEGQIEKRFSNRPEHDSWGIGPHVKKEPMRSWGPKSGEWIGIMVSTPARGGEPIADLKERSDIFWVKWPR